MVEQCNYQPEKQRQDSRGADVDAAAGNGREAAADEAGHEEHEGLPDAEVGNGFEGLAFVLPAEEIEAR